MKFIFLIKHFLLNLFNINKKISFIKTIYTICFFLFLFITSFSFADNSLTVVWSSFPPHQYIDKQGNLTGMNIELITTIIKKAGYEPNFIEAPWERGLNMLKNGEADIVMSAVKTLDRHTYAYFSDTYFKLEYNVLFIRAEDKKKYKSIKSLKDIIGTDLRLGVLIGGIYSKEYEKLLNNKEFIKNLDEEKSSDQNIKKLVNKRIDGMITEELYGLYKIKEYGYLNQVSILFFLFDEEEAAGYLMFSKKSMKKEQVEKINKILKEIKANGTYEKIINKYKSDLLNK